jgi:hypothetical protein
MEKFKHIKTLHVINDEDCIRQAIYVLIKYFEDFQKINNIKINGFSIYIGNTFVNDKIEVQISFYETNESEH